MHQEEKRGQEKVEPATTGQTFTEDGDKKGGGREEKTERKDKRSRLRRQKSG